MFNYKNPIGASVITIPESLGTLTNPLGTNFSVYSVGGYMEVWSVSDLNFSATSSAGFVQLSANTIPPYINKQVNGNVQAYLWSDGISSGRRRLGQLVYVHQDDQVYQFVIPNYETLWNNADGEGAIQFSAPYYIVTSSPSFPNGTLLVNAWTASTVEGYNGVTRDNARWRIFWGTDWQVTGGSYSVSSETLNLFSNSGNTVQITGVTNFYNSNGSLYSNRSVNLSGYSLTFSGGQTIFSGSNPVVISGLTQGGGNYLTIDNNGVVRFTGVTPGGSVNIYNSDGSLTSNRNVNLGSFTLNFSGNQTSFVNPTTPLFISATTDPLRVSGVSIGSPSNKILVIDDSGYVKFINSISTESFTLTVPVNTTNITYSGNSGTTSSVNISGTSGVTVVRSNSTGLTISAQTIYTSDGTISSNRNVNLNNNSLAFSGGAVSITGSGSSLRILPSLAIPNQTSRFLFTTPTDPTVRYYTGLTFDTNFTLSDDNGGVNPVIRYSVGATNYPITVSGSNGTTVLFNSTSQLSISSSTLYNSNGLLSENRNVNLNGRTLSFTGGSVSLSSVTINGLTNNQSLTRIVVSDSNGFLSFRTGITQNMVTGASYNSGIGILRLLGPDSYVLNVTDAFDYITGVTLTNNVIKTKNNYTVQPEVTVGTINAATGGTYNSNTGVITLLGTGTLGTISGITAGTSSSGTLTGITYTASTGTLFFGVANSSPVAVNQTWSYLSGVTSTGNSFTLRNNLGSSTAVTINAATGGSYSNGTITLSGSGTLSNITGLPTGTTGGAGTINFVPLWTATTSLGDSVIQQNSGNIGIGVSPGRKLDVNGDVSIRGNLYFTSTTNTINYNNSPKITFDKGSSNPTVLVGNTVGSSLDPSLTRNVFVGNQIGVGVNTNSNTNLVLGSEIFKTNFVNPIEYNIILGSYLFDDLTDASSYNIVLANNSLTNVTAIGDNNVILGNNIATTATTLGGDMIMMGNNSGKNLSSGSNSIIIGGTEFLENSSTSNDIILGSSNNSAAFSSNSNIVIGNNNLSGVGEPVDIINVGSGSISSTGLTSVINIGNNFNNGGSGSLNKVINIGNLNNSGGNLDKSITIGNNILRNATESNNSVIIGNDNFSGNNNIINGVTSIGNNTLSNVLSTYNFLTIGNDILPNLGTDYKNTSILDLLFVGNNILTGMTSIVRDSLVIGNNVGGNVLSSFDNSIIIGTQVSPTMTSSSENIYLGNFGGDFKNDSNNVIVGNRVFYTSNSGSTDNVSIGHDTMYYVDDSKYNTVIGQYSMYSANNTSGNTIIGYNSGYNLGNAGASTNNILIGRNTFSGEYNSLSNNNVIIGNYAGPQASTNSTFWLANFSGTPMLYGTFSASTSRSYHTLGINTASWSGNGVFEVYDPANSGTSIWAQTDIVAFSDERVKTKIQRIENALEKVMKLNGVTFERLDIEKNRRMAGVIAQEVERVLPEVVYENSDGMKSVAYGNLISLLIESVKELKLMIDNK